MKSRASRLLLTIAVCVLTLVAQTNASWLDLPAGPVPLDLSERLETGVALTLPRDLPNATFDDIDGISDPSLGFITQFSLDPVKDGSFLTFYYSDAMMVWRSEVSDAASPYGTAGSDTHPVGFDAPEAPPDLLNETSSPVPDQGRPINADIEAQIAIAEPVEIVSPLTLGVPTPIVEFLYAAIRLIGIVAGIAMILSMIRIERRTGRTAVFLTATATASVIGLLSHSAFMDTPRIIGILSLLALATAALAFYGRRPARLQRPVFIASATVALYLNVAGGVAEVFQALPALHLIAPTQTETPFLLAQFAVLVVLALLAVLAMTRVDVTRLNEAGRPPSDPDRRVREDF